MDTEQSQPESDNSGTAAQRSSLPLRLAEKLGASIHAKTIYGDPVERNGITIIPVARARWGFGGGGGRKAGEEGSGGGGGADLRPVGFIEIKDGGAIFKPIPDPSFDRRRMAFLGFFVMMALQKFLMRRRKG